MARHWQLYWHAFRQSATRLRHDTRAAAGVEYGLLVALIAIAILGTLKGLGLSLINLPLPALVTAFEGALS